VDSGGNCISLEAIDPSAIADTESRPENLICGLIDTEIKVDTPGGVPNARQGDTAKYWRNLCPL